MTTTRTKDKLSFSSPLSRSASDDSANLSYENFRDNNISALVRTTPPSFRGDFPHTSSQARLSSNSLSGQLSGLKSLSVKAVDKTVPGLGLYLKPKMLVAGVALGSHRRIESLLNNNVGRTTSVVCGMAGSITQATVSSIGNGAVITAAGGMIATSGGAALLPASMFAAGSFSVIGNGSRALGDLTEQACVKVANKMQSQAIRRKF